MYEETNLKVNKIIYYLAYYLEVVDDLEFNKNKNNSTIRNIAFELEIKNFSEIITVAFFITTSLILARWFSS